MQAIIQGGAIVAVPSIADYEIRRELIRCGKPTLDLDGLRTVCSHIPFCDVSMKKAAEYWGRIRNVVGKPPPYDPTANRLDQDAMICGQAWAYAQEINAEAIIATENIRHFEMLKDPKVIIDVKSWRDIYP